MDRPGVAVRYMWQLNASRCRPESILFTCLIKAAVPRLRMLSAGKCRPCLFLRLQGLNTSEAGNCAHSVYLVLFRTLPDVPSISEVVPEYEATTWYGVVAPRDTSTAIV